MSKPCIRKVEYKLYPTVRQEAALQELLIHHHQLYNWALKDRIETYRNFGYGLTFQDQCLINTQYRQRRKKHGIFNANAQSEQVTLKRIQWAFDGFFRRLSNGQTPGFPRLKAFARFKGWGYKAHGDGWKLHLREKKHGAVYLADVGIIKLRGQARNEAGKPKTAEVLKRHDGWYLSVSFEYENIVRHSGERAQALDWGLEFFATIVNDQGQVHQIDNPRFLKVSSPKIALLQKEKALAAKGSRAHRKLKYRLANLHAKVARQRKDFIHKTTANLVATSAVIAVEALTVQRMTCTARGTVEKPGTNVKQKAGLNKAILDTAPSTLYHQLKTKAEEAGILVMEANTLKLKPSQTCPNCGAVKPKLLNERTHHCKCGYSAPRDVASAQVVLNWALGIQGSERAQCS